MTSRMQDRLIGDLVKRGHKPDYVYKYKYIPYIAMMVDGGGLESLLSSSDVITVEEDTPVPPALDVTVPHIGASRLHGAGVKGEGVAVAVLDTGVDKNHPFLRGSVIAEACYSTNLPEYSVSSLCPSGVQDSVGEGSAAPYGGICPFEKCSHGTHVAGIIAGRSGISGSPGPGVAPKAGIIAMQVFSRFDADDYCGVGQSPCIMSWTSDQMKALERVYELRDSFLIAAVNVSLGGGRYSSHCDADPRKAYVDKLRAAGVATVIASGNQGYCDAVSAPACISSAISVGATDDWDSVAYYSNSAPILSLLAPGSSVISSIPLADGGGYRSLSGTSMAAPHVAGVWALIKQVRPAATVSDILRAFTSTGLRVSDENCSSVTKQRINVYEAYRFITPRTIVAVDSFLYSASVSDGIWQWDGTSWRQITRSNPETMAAAGSLLYGDFGPAGVGSGGIWQWDGTSWRQITRSNPETMTAAGSFLYGDFAADGIWIWDGSSWTKITSSNPETMAAAGSFLYGDFGPAGVGYGGIWQWDGTSWKQIGW